MKRFLWWLIGTIGFLLFFILFAAVGMNCGMDTVDLNTANKEKQEQLDIILTQVQSTLEPFMKQQVAQYNDLSAKFDALQKEHSALQAALTETQKTSAGYQAELAGIKAENRILNSELVNTRTSLQNAINEQAKLETKVAQDIAEMASLRQAVTNASEAYRDILAKITDINNRTDSTIDDFTEAKRIIFYELWDEWWQDEME